MRALAHTNPPKDFNDATLLVDTAISTAAYATRASIHQTMGISPGSVVFCQDMFLDIPLIANLYLLQQSRQVLIDKQLMMANAKIISFDYQPGQKVLKLAVSPNMLDLQYKGPYSISTVHTSGMVRMQLIHQIQEHINICQI